MGRLTPGMLRRVVFRLAYGRPRLWMSELRKLRARLQHPQAHVEFGRGTYVGPGFSLEALGPATFVTGEGVELRRGFRAELAGSGRIVIGARSVCTYDVLMQCTTSIEIGERCMIGQATMILDGQHRFRETDRPLLEQGYDFTPITIGDDAWVTSKTTVMASIGKRAVIAAHAVVTRPVPPYSVAAGVPAKVIDTFGPGA